jgi:hypothetical protein
MKRISLMAVCIAVACGIGAVTAATSSAWILLKSFHADCISPSECTPVYDEVLFPSPPREPFPEIGTSRWTGVEYLGAKCSSPGANPGELVVPVKLELGWINKPKNELGMLESIQKGPVAATCGANTLEFRGGAIGQLTPANKFITTKQHFTDSLTLSGGKQANTSFEGGSTSVLEASVNKGPFAEVTDEGNAQLSSSRGLTASGGGFISGRPGPVFFTKALIGDTAGPVPISGTIGASFLESKGASKINCTGGSTTGEVTDEATLSNVAVTFTGCETSGVKCTSPPAAEGTVKTVPLLGTLGNVTLTLPALRLYSEAEGKGGKLAEFECAGGAVKVIVTGSVMGSLSGASGKSFEEGKLASSLKLTFSQAKGVQKYTKFFAGEGEEGTEQLSASIGGGPFELSGLSAVATLKTTPFASNLGLTK